MEHALWCRKGLALLSAGQQVLRSNGSLQRARTGVEGQQCRAPVSHGNGTGAHQAEEAVAFLAEGGTKRAECWTNSHMQKHALGLRHGRTRERLEDRLKPREAQALSSNSESHRSSAEPGRVSSAERGVRRIFLDMTRMTFWKRRQISHASEMHGSRGRRGEQGMAPSPEAQEA